MENENVLGVDIGGSHITATRVDLKSGKVIKNSEVREPVIARGSSVAIISLWSDVIKRAFANELTNASKIGVAMPGPFDYKSGIAWIQSQKIKKAALGEDASLIGAASCWAGDRRRNIGTYTC